VALHLSYDSSDDSEVVPTHSEGIIFSLKILKTTTPAQNVGLDMEIVQKSGCAVKAVVCGLIKKNPQASKEEC